MKIKQAALLARFVHFNQKRQDGEDYINHCERIANSLYQKFAYNHMKGIGLGESFTTEEDIVCTAWLHDCIEDADYPDSIRDIIFDYFTFNTSYLVELLTHYSTDSYIEYMKRIVDSKIPEALQIKWLDMIDNTSYKIPEKQWLKYRSACIFLQEKGIEIPEILKERLKV